MSVDQDRIKLIRDDENLREAAVRQAIDAVYGERDNGGTMHSAGEMAAAVVLAVVAEALESAYHPQNPIPDHPADFIERGFAASDERQAPDGR